MVLSNFGRLLNDPRHFDASRDVREELEQGHRAFVLDLDGLRDLGSVGPRPLDDPHPPDPPARRRRRPRRTSAPRRRSSSTRCGWTATGRSSRTSTRPRLLRRRNDEPDVAGVDPDVGHAVRCRSRRSTHRPGRRASDRPPCVRTGTPEPRPAVAAGGSGNGSRPARGRPSRPPRRRPRPAGPSPAPAPRTPSGPSRTASGCRPRRTAGAPGRSSSTAGRSPGTGASQAELRPARVPAPQGDQDQAERRRRRRPPPPRRKAGDSRATRGPARRAGARQARPGDVEPVIDGQADGELVPEQRERPAERAQTARPTRTRPGPPRSPRVATPSAA